MKRLLITGGSGFIGTNCVIEAVRRGWDCVNFDIKEPRYNAHARYWRQVDLRDAALLSAAVRDYRPTHVVHLAAKTGMDVKDISEFSANIEGIDYLLTALKEVGKVERIIVTSSLLVCRNGYVPSSDTDYCPPNLYGESKVETEKRTRAVDTAELPWVIVRPTSVWGPWFAEPYKDFFELVRKGFYMHPGSEDVVKPTTYVGNAVHMMLTMLEVPRETVVGRTFYLADWPEVSVRQWAEIVQKTFRAAPIRTLPLPLMRGLALCGDLLKALGVKNPPLTSFRLRNIRTGAHYPWEKTEDVVGVLPFPVADGVRETVQWLKTFD